jgi:hypothetical protein
MLGIREKNPVGIWKSQQVRPAAAGSHRHSRQDAHGTSAYCRLPAGCAGGILPPVLENGLRPAARAPAVSRLGESIAGGGALLAAGEVGFQLSSTLDATPFGLLAQLILALAGDFQFFKLVFYGSHFAIDTILDNQNTGELKFAQENYESLVAANFGLIRLVSIPRSSRGIFLNSSMNGSDLSLTSLQCSSISKRLKGLKELNPSPHKPSYHCKGRQHRQSRLPKLRPRKPNWPE